MAQFRRNHSRQGRGLQSSFRMVILLMIAIILLAMGLGWVRHSMLDLPASNLSEEVDGSNRTFLPSSPDEVVHHTHYSLGYSELREQAAWVAYVLEENTLRKRNVRRSDRFEPDPLVSGGSAVYSDYSHSGYTRGHLAPAGDMAFEEKAMQESFLMSNISPQSKVFNNGVWKELEMQVRQWAEHDKRLYVVTGPVFRDSLGIIGKRNKIVVPGSFYKVILYYEGPEKRAVAFLVPHALSDKPLDKYMVPVDRVEALTGIDFFRNMINDEEEEALERSFSKSLWPLDQQLYQKRVEIWNKE